MEFLCEVNWLTMSLKILNVINQILIFALLTVSQLRFHKFWGKVKDLEEDRVTKLQCEF